MTCKSRESMYSGGFGSGKSWALVWKALALAMNHPGIQILVGRARNPMLRFTTMRDFDNLCPPEWIRTHRKAEQRYILFNGSEILFRQCYDHDELKGLTLGAALLDEWTEIPEASTTTIRGRLRQPDMPGILAGVTNPAGRTHYLYKQFVDPTERKRRERSWFSASSLENINTPQAYRDSLVEEFTGTDFERFVGGAWTDPDTVVWDTFDRARCTGPTPQLGAHGQVELSIDFGFEHWFCALWGCWDQVHLPDADFERCLVFRQYWGRKRQLTEHAEAITTHIAEDQALGIPAPAVVWADSAGAQERHELRSMSNRALRIDTRGARKDRLAGIRSVRGAFKPSHDGWPKLMLCAEQSRFSPKDAPNLVDQVESFQRPEGETREDVVISHDSKGESIDDGADALRYLWFSHARDRFHRSVGYDPGMDEISRRRMFNMRS